MWARLIATVILVVSLVHTPPTLARHPPNQVAQAVELERQMWLAWRDKDWATVSALTAPDYYATNGTFAWSFFELKREFPKIDMQSYSLGEIRGVPINATATLLSYKAKIVERYAGKDISGTYLYTTVWVKRGESWLMIFEQEVPAPPEEKRSDKNK
jgi:hypothetical protein